MDKQQEQVERSQKLDAAGAAAVPPPATSVPPPPPAGVQAPSGVDDFHTTLHGLTAALFQRFPDATARLEQLASHLATVHMLIDHIHSEQITRQEANTPDDEVREIDRQKWIHAEMPENRGHDAVQKIAIIVPKRARPWIEKSRAVPGLETTKHIIPMRDDAGLDTPIQPVTHDERKSVA